MTSIACWSDPSIASDPDAGTSIDLDDDGSSDTALETGPTDSGSDAGGDQNSDTTEDAQTDVQDVSEDLADTGQDTGADLSDLADDLANDTNGNDPDLPIDADGDGEVGVDSEDSSDAADAVDSDDERDGSDTADVEVDTWEPPGCEYPLIWVPDPTAEASAAAALNALNPDADLTWDDVQGTFTRLGSIDLELGCEDDDTDVWALLRTLVEDNPNLFQADSDEWRWPAPVPCRAVSGPGNTTITLGRSQLGDALVNRDIMTFTLQRVDDVVRLWSVFGNYLPTVPRDLAEEMRNCVDLSLPEARQLIASEALPYTLFAYCGVTGAGTYTPHENDTLELDESEFLWSENGAEGWVELTKIKHGRLIIHPDNWTPELESSDVNCPEEEGGGRILGFRVTFEVVEEAFIGSMPGIGCIVCLN